MSERIARLNEALRGRYHIERELGEGGMATVYLAQDLKHDRRVALKVIKPELAAVVGAERFLAEIRTTANLQHPHILPLFDSGDADGALFYAMPYVEGESLRERLDRAGRLELDEALSITRDVGSALAYAHGRGIVHRDIKPANVLISDGEALVADFGIARAVASAEEPQLTATGILVGTPAYMSPEQIEGAGDIDGRSDVYALGCLLFEMLGGRPPFSGGTVQARIAQALTEPAPSLRSLVADVPPDVDAAVQQAMAKRPEERFESARALHEACEQVGTTPEARLRTPAVAATAVLLLALVAAFAWRAVQTANAQAALPEIERLAAAGDIAEAFDLAVAAERWIDGDSSLVDLMGEVSNRLTVVTDPPGAEVTIERILPEGEEPAEAPITVTSPVDVVRLPRADHRVVVELDGYLTEERVVSTELARELGFSGEGVDEIRLTFSMRSQSDPRPEMVVVPGGEYGLTSPDAPTGLSVELHDFMIDRFEVSNEDFKRFIDGGGYAADSLWRGVPDGVRPELVDRTGLPGPRSWTGQSHAERDGRLAVTDVSWYEARAFCRAKGKRLPTIFEWEKTARDGQSSRTGVVMPWGYQGVASPAIVRANFDGDGPRAVDAYPYGISPYGAHAMAGNVREWISNPFGDGRGVTGGAWDGPSYLYTEYASRPAVAASPALGFRCASSDGSSDQGGFLIDLDTRTPVYTPVGESTYRSLLEYYRYDAIAPNPRSMTTETTSAWTRERLWIDGPEGDSILVYFYAPTSAPPPYQTIVFLPGSNAFSTSYVPDIAERIIAPAIRAGRAVLLVVLQRMVERRSGPASPPPPPPSVGFRDLMVRHATELRLGLDYAETRSDVDPEKFSYVAVSWGAGSRLALSAVDDRFRAVVYIGGGIDERMKPTLPEADNVNFAPYVRAPKLLLNGASDEEHPWLSRALPLWNLLSEPKELVLVEGGGHVVGPEYRFPAINDFLDAVLGPVER